MDRKIKVGVFGAYRGMTMIEVLSGHPDAELTAVCDKYRPALGRVKELAEKKGMEVALYEDFEEFFQADMDAVVLANYANEHAPYAIRLLKSGRHVLSEVLPCETMAQAAALVDAVEESGKVYAYAENYCYRQRTFEMWRRYEAGEIGEVQYAEGEYIHDCSSIWPEITYGDPSHWRNRAYSTFYCTHSLGPILTITGRRPVQVVGFETNQNRERRERVSLNGGNGGIEMVTLDNGAVVKSVHGGLKREPGSVNYEVYGTKGSMETNRFEGEELGVYIEGEKLCGGKFERYQPAVRKEAEQFATHGGSDFFPTHYFLQKIKGREDGKKYSIDVYTAVDMGICGILAYRSILNGNIPVKVPDFRKKAERDAYRNDCACTNPEIASKEELLPLTKDGNPDVPAEEYELMKHLWQEGKRAE